MNQDFAANYAWLVPALLALVAAVFYVGILSPHSPSDSLSPPIGFKAVNYSVNEEGELTLVLEQNTGRKVHFTGLACSTGPVDENPFNVEVHSESGGVSNLTEKAVVECVGVDPNQSYYYGSVFVWYAAKGDAGFTRMEIPLIYNFQE